MAVDRVRSDQRENGLSAHTVQQRQGQVRATRKMMTGLESEAGSMGRKAPMQLKRVWGGVWLGQGGEEGGHQPEHHVPVQPPPVNNLALQPQHHDLAQQPPGNDLAQQPPVNDLAQHQPVNDLAQQPPVNDLAQQPPVNDLAQQPPVNDLAQHQPVNDLAQQPSGNDLAQQVPGNDLAQHQPVNNLVQQPLVNNLVQQPPVNDLRQQPRVNNQRRHAQQRLVLNDDVRQPLLPRQQQQQESGSRLGDLANFMAINSPGTQTGAVGLASGVNSMLSPPKQIPGTSGYLKATGNYTTGVGAGLNVLGGGSDLLATGQSLNSMRKEGGVRGFFRGIRDTFSRRNKETGKQAETRSTAKRLAVDLPVNLADASSQGMQAANAISSLTHAGTSILPAATGVATAGIGAGVQTVVAGRAGYRAYRSHQHKKEVDELRASARYRRMSPKNKAAADHLSKQLGKRRKRNILGGIGAGIGAVGGGLLLAGLLGVAAATPIGWALAGVGALAAAGLGAYKLHRHFKKKREGRLGTDRETHATNLHRAVTKPVTKPKHAQDKRHALAILKSHGVTEEQASDPARGHQLIKRKLEGW
jgi:uncharacterized membrane protein YebE (DUF533 family)